MECYSVKQESLMLTGLIRMAEVTGDAGLKKQVLSLMEQVVSVAGTAAVFGYDAAALFTACEWTGQSIYEDAVRRTAAYIDKNLENMPFFMAYETVYCKKEHYSEIVTAFREAEPLSEKELMHLIDVLSCTSQEIYEVYDELSQMFRREVRRFLEHPEPTEEAEEKAFFLYALLCGCSSGVLLKEKYIDHAYRLLGQVHPEEMETAISHGRGLDLMILAQAARLRIQETDGL